MIKNIAIVSLSRGVAGEAFAQHEVEIGLKRLAGYGVNVQFMPNALRGIDYLTTHPEARAADLLQAFRDPEVDMILCAIGGDDTYRLPPPICSTTTSCARPSPIKYFSAFPTRRSTT